MALIIKEEKKLFPSIKRNRLPITKNILQNIREDKLLSVTDLNIDTALQMVWAGFMRMIELTYIVAEPKKAAFVETGLIRSDISFAKGDQYVILRLK